MIALAVIIIALDSLAAITMRNVFLYFSYGRCSRNCRYFLYRQKNFRMNTCFVDGQIDFDRIIGGESRKTMKRMILEKVEVVAPEHSHASGFSIAKHVI